MRRSGLAAWIEIRTTRSSADEPALTEAECIDGDLDELVDDHHADLVCESLTVVDATVVPE